MERVRKGKTGDEKERETETTGGRMGEILSTTCAGE
jgi:hypothetical protein